MFRKRPALDGAPDQIELIEGGTTGKDFSNHSVASDSKGLSFPAPVLQSASTRLRGVATMFRRHPSQTNLSEPSLVLRGGRHAKGLTRLGLPKGSIMMYFDDLYHTLLNMPRHRFLASFFSVYLMLYLAFAFFYVAYPSNCFGWGDIANMSFNRAFWFSVWTASTIGYSADVGPDPECKALNALITVQLMVAALVDTMLMSIVFSRFAAPMPRASTIRFSQHAVLARQQGSPFWALTVRLANIRKHSLLEPQVDMLLAVPKGQGSVAFRFLPLKIDDAVTQITALRLGLPATLTHTVDASSPLYNMSLQDMEGHGMEVLCFMCGVDPMTSNTLQAQHAWHSADIRMNEAFAAIGLATTRGGKLGLDLSEFDTTTAAEVGMGFKDESQAVLVPVPEQEGQSAEGVRLHMQDLRTRTIASLSLRRKGSSHSLDESDDGTTPAPPTLPLSYTAAGNAAKKSHLSAQPLTADVAAVGVAGGMAEWDASVKQLCEAIAADLGADPAVKQQAMALHAALMAVPLATPAVTVPASKMASRAVTTSGAGASGPSSVIDVL